MAVVGNAARFSRRGVRVEHADYFGERDIGIPSQSPDPSDFEQTVLSAGSREDKLTWTFNARVSPQERGADGFIIFWESAATADPSVNRAKVSVASRSWAHFAPAGAVVSYAIAAYRNSHQGEQVGPKRSLSTWQGATSGNEIGQEYIDLAPVETPDGSRVNFTWTVQPSLSVNGKPIARLVWRRADVQYTADNPPAPGQWTLAAGVVIVGEAPEAGDWFVFARIVGA